MLNFKSFILGVTVGFSCTALLSGASPQLQHTQNFSEETSETPLIPRHLLFGNPVKASPQLSPDGTKLAYLAPDANNVLNVWVRDLTEKDTQKETEAKTGQAPDRMITADQKRGVRSFYWQLDNQSILYIQDQEGDENWHLYQTSIETKETKDLTPFEGATVDIVDYDPRFPQEMLVQINHRNKALFDVYRLNLKTGECLLDTENLDGVFHWVADHELQVRACQSYTKDGSTLIRVRDDGKSPWRELLTIDPNESGSVVVSFTPDNRSLYLVSSLGGNTTRLLKVSLSGAVFDGKQEVLIEDPQYDLTDVLINPLTHELEAVAVERDRFGWIVLDPLLKGDFDYLQQASPKGVFKLLSRDLANREWIVGFASDQSPTKFYLYQRGARKLSFLFSTQPELEQYRLSSMLPVSYQARDGMTIHGYLTLPEDKEPRHLATILLVHGGPWVRDSWGLSPSVQWLANRGYAVFQINYRGSTGYGKDYLNAGNKEWAGKMHEDLLDGKKWLIEKGYANPEKTAIYGGSYGGYATLVGLAFTPDEFCCGIDVVGPSSLITLLQTIPPYWGPLKAQMDRRLGNLETDQEFLKSRSPLFKADRIKKPLLIGQGANDPRVKQAESDQIVRAMRQNQLDVEYLLFADEGHGFVRPENRMKFFAAAEEFLSKYLGGRQQPPSAEENWESLKN